MTREYHFLHLAVCNCILLTAFKSELAPWYSQLLYAIGTGRPVCLASVYIDYIVHLTRSASRIQHLKGSWAIHRICEVVGIPTRPTDSF